MNNRNSEEKKDIRLKKKGKKSIFGVSRKQNGRNEGLKLIRRQYEEDKVLKVKLGE